jgi:NADH:ubiquinone oxidoreductase subunit C
VNVERCLEQIREACPSHEVQVYSLPINETVVELPTTCLKPVVTALVEQGTVHHLSTITGQDVGDIIQLLYHFWEGSGLTLRTSLPRDESTIPSLTDLIPGAAFYEREVAEMLHVTFEGHPEPHGLLLPDDWDDTAPLRKEFSAPSSKEEPT